VAPSEATHLTAFYSSVEPDDRAAAEALAPTVYSELRALAGALFSDQPAGHTLQPTALVNEVYLKLGSTASGRWNDRHHFMALAARAMRQVLTDHARAKRALKRGGAAAQLTLVEDQTGGAGVEIDPIELDDTLNELARFNDRYARVVELRYLAGLTIDEVATVLSVSRRTVELDWRAARAWLRVHLEPEATP
jgi:RNA polymerase sigma factor (TIGR02999 family)